MFNNKLIYNPTSKRFDDLKSLDIQNFQNSLSNLSSSMMNEKVPLAEVIDSLIDLVKSVSDNPIIEALIEQLDWSYNAIETHEKNSKNMKPIQAALARNSLEKMILSFMNQFQWELDKKQDDIQNQQNTLTESQNTENINLMIENDQLDAMQKQAEREQEKLLQKSWINSLMDQL